ncbi:MAG: DUF6794 domain-containing protein, partial [Bacteroidota bacterium]
MRSFFILVFLLIHFCEAFSQLGGLLIKEGSSVGDIRLGIPISKVLDLKGQGQVIEWGSYSYELRYPSEGISYYYLQSDSTKSVFSISMTRNFNGITSQGLVISDTLKVEDITSIYGEGEWDGYDIDENGNASIEFSFYDIGLFFIIDIDKDFERNPWTDFDVFYAKNRVIEIYVEEGDGEENAPNEPIPSNLKECFTSLDTVLSDSFKIELKELSTSDLVVKTHFGLGLWIRNSWGLWAGSKLSEFFNQLGVY